MEKERSESSFAGFLNDYSRGNFTLAKPLNDIVTLELSKLVATIEELKSIAESIGASQFREQLSLAKDTLLKPDESNYDKLVSFGSLMDVILVLYNATANAVGADARSKLTHLFNKLVVEYLTIIKKIGDKQLLVGAISLIQKIE